MHDITLTEFAIDAFHNKLEERKTPNAFIRLGVKSGGCVGMKYVIAYEDDKPKDTDIQFLFRDVHITIDIKSIVYLDGCTVDYKKDLIEQGFLITNPKETKRCGCGSSFVI